MPVLGFATWAAASWCGTGRARVPASMFLDSLLLLLDPAVELLGRHHVHGDEHLAVKHPAQLGALALVLPDFFDLEPDVIDASRIRVHLDPERRHEPAVDHVDRRDVSGNRFSHREYERIVC